MRVFFLSRRTVAHVVMVVCLALVSIAYARIIMPSGEPSAQASTGATKLHPVYSVDRGKEKMIAISFDAAWGAEKTEAIMDIVEERGIKTTFFLVGFWIDKYPEKVAMISDRGHEIGNHSNKHPRMTELTPEKMREELDLTAGKIADIIGTRPTLFRCPYGAYDNRVITTANELGYQVIQWDIDSLDWKEEGINVMIQRVVGKVKPGSIVLFHNNSRDIVEALPTILDRIIADGYTIVPVSELLLSGDTMVDQQGIQRIR